MLPRHQDPIVAIATAPGRGAVGIVRVSGKSLSSFVAAMFGRALKPREATYLPFNDASGAAIDQGLAIYFTAPHSYTGEDVLELQAHGGPVVLQLLLSRCLQLAQTHQLLPNLRLAQPGEFTERAFLNDKLDLAQAEAVADLIEASTEAAAKSAARSLSGAFSERVHALRDALINLRMLVEATLDFPEEEIDFLTKADASGQLARLREQVAALQKQAGQGALLREGVRVVIAGQPNAGKSSLLNALAGAELAIVTPIAGTTRDKVSETIQIQGVPIHITDTAGLREDSEASDEVERIGIARAWAEMERADVLLHVHDWAAECDHSQAQRTRDARAGILARIEARVPARVPRLEVWNKIDATRAPPPTLENSENNLALSAKTGAGLEPLRAKLLQLAGWQAAPEGIFIARERHVQALAACSEHLGVAAEHLAAQAQSLDLLAEELRLAQNALGEITGEFTSDDLLGVIFSRFCIGK
jgi:tRNA modification GTPase